MKFRLKAEMAVEKEIEVKQKSRLRENVEAILVAVLLALFIRTFIVQAFKIPSGWLEDPEPLMAAVSSPISRVRVISFLINCSAAKED